MKKIRYLIEAILLYALYYTFKILPLDIASNAGGAIASFLGPKMGVSKKALRNLQDTMPDRSAAEQQAIIKEMWDNLGRVIAEYPHLAQIGRERVEIINGDVLTPLTKKDQPAIIFGGHFANWEATGSAALTQYHLETIAVYRAPNNPWVNKLLEKARRKSGYTGTIAKSRAGSRQIMHKMQANENIAFLIDQKYNEGEEYPFMGRPAMTADMFARLAQKYDCPLVPIQMKRLNQQARFTLTIHTPIPTKDENGDNRPIADIITDCHALLEAAIKDNPGQWLWLHRRWH